MRLWMQKRYLYYGIGAGVILFLLLGTWPMATTLTLSSNKEGTSLWSHPVSPGDRFIIRFTHSVDKTDVDEVIRVGKEDLIIDSTVYQSFGAGLPSTLHGEETMELEDGKMRIDHLNRPQKSIDLFIGQVVANHRLVVDGKVIPLKKLSPPGTSVRLSVERENLFSYLRRCLSSGGTLAFSD
ncbi:DUF1850 domain-containing protein [Kroppenstedtia eburnea]|uniref:DUF1850 domain-containing protein n=1 Tax=Kroppenstedtia eburnea TaxID=714067 RepID=A0A1N7MJ97_9BACL|nr:DUF1850 domain-containing protein [Kroppenstedtia eburnea]QKI81612.1 DUF1850 domain-containing protein [Kroppenstedtia eburnea]SIS86244.1 hypothetical protein SAMN05421790_106140 [Kroppenstedtia eburnea]